MHRSNNQYLDTAEWPTSIGVGRVNVGTTERVVSVAGGLLLAAYGLRRMSVAGLGLAATGGVLIFRGVTGYCPVNAAVGRDSARTGRKRGVVVQTTITVNRPREEVYAFWRRLEDLPRFMHHLSEVRELDDRRSHWVAPIPKVGGFIAWDAELIVEKQNLRLAWRSVEGADVDNAGEVRFDDAPGGRGTEVHVHLAYHPPGSGAGEAASRLLNPIFEQMIKEDLRRFKHVMEAGEIPTIEGQPTGR